MRAAAFFLILGTFLLTGLTAAIALADDEVEVTREAARELSNPVPYAPERIREGRKHYLRLCQNCHGRDGRALENIDFEASDLTVPDLYRHGATDGDIFFSIKEGAGFDMPGFADKLTDEQVWEVVHFIRSIGPESHRPEPADEAGRGSDGAGEAHDEALGKEAS